MKYQVPEWEWQAKSKALRKSRPRLAGLIKVKERFDTGQDQKVS